MKVKTVFKLFLGMATSLCAPTALAEYLPNTLKGIAITPFTLEQLAPKMPSKVQKQINAWLEQPDTHILMHHVSVFSSPDNWARDMQQSRELLEQLGYENMSKNNYAARIPGTDFVFKIDGHKNRVLSMLANKGILDADTIPDEVITKYVANLHETPTYQTASRMAYYLVLKDRMHKHGYKYVHLPESYLVHIPGKPHTVQDGNLFIVQKIVPHAFKLYEYPEFAKSLSAGVIEELYDAVVSVGLWNISNNILMHKNGSIYVTCSVDLVGLTEPKNASAKDFFHKNKDRFDENVYLGLKSLLTLFSSEQNKAHIARLIKADKRLQGSHYYRDILNLL